MKKIFSISLLIFIFISEFCFSEATMINDPRWSIFFENIQIVAGSVAAIQEPEIIAGSKTEISYSVSLTLPREFYEFTVDVINDGTIDAMVSEVNINELTSEQQKYLKYTVTYSDGISIKKYDLLKAGEKEKLKIRLEFRDDINVEDLPNTDTTITLSSNTYYVQADENAKEREKNVPPPQDDEETNNNTPSDEEENDSKEDDDKKDNKESDDNKTTNTDKNTITEREKGGILNNTIENNIVSNGDDITNNSIVSKIIKTAKTGDNIIKYFIILILAIMALVIANKKKKNDK